MRGVENIEGPTPSLGYMFATRSIVHVVGVLSWGAELHVQHPCTKNHQNPYIRYIYRKFAQLLATETKLVNWSIESKTLQFQRKVTASFVTTPGSKLV